MTPTDSASATKGGAPSSTVATNASASIAYSGFVLGTSITRGSGATGGRDGSWRGGIAPRMTICVPPVETMAPGAGYDVQIYRIDPATGEAVAP